MEQNVPALWEESQSGLELAMQELEALEAPGFWTAVGASVGATVVSAAAYGGYYVVSVSIVST